jgi:putative hydrolase of the HAD superfamily
MEKLIFPTINLSGVKGVLLDIDNTIYHYETCHNYALNILLSRLSTIVSNSKKEVEEEFMKSRQKINEQLHGTASSHSRFLYVQLTLEFFFGKTAFYHTLKMEKLYWDTFLSKMIIDDRAFKFINQCNNKKIPICCVTDLTTEIQFRKIVTLNLEDKISFIVTSEEAGIEKPEKKIFDLALEKMKLNYKDVIMVGDSASKDIAGAENLGVKSYLVKSI